MISSHHELMPVTADQLHIPYFRNQYRSKIRKLNVNAYIASGPSQPPYIFSPVSMALSVALIFKVL